MKKILIIQTRVGIGDMCVFLPCIHEIGKALNSFEIHLLTKKRTCSKEFLYQDPYIKKIIYLPDENGLKLNISIFKLIKKEGYSHCYIMHYSLRYFILSLLSGIKKIYHYGFFKKKESIIEKSRIAVSNWLKKENLEFIPLILLNQKSNKKSQITIGIGGSGSDKKWKIENYQILLEKILKKNDIKNILIAGGPDEENEASLIINFLRNKSSVNIINLCKLNILKCMKYLPQSKFYVGNDTGFMHLSGSLNVPSFGIFGATPPDYSNYNKILFAIKPPGIDSVTYGDEMMNQITPQFVYDFLKENKYVD